MNIKNKALQVITTYGTCDAFRICNELNITVVRQPLGNETKGLIYKYEYEDANEGEDNYIVCINSDLTEHEQLRTCAHELGHYLIHKHINSIFLHRCTFLKTDRYEREAEAFADALMNELFKHI